MTYLLATLIAWNIYVFFMYAADKHRAIKGKWRISERTLIICAFSGGGIGAFCGMFAFRHKTKHIKFRLALPVAAILTTALLWFIKSQISFSQVFFLIK